MKIVYVTPFYPPHLGGLELVAQKLAEGMVQNGHIVRVFTSTQNADSIEYPQKHLEVHRLHTFRGTRRALVPSLLKQLLKQKDADLFHVHVAQAYLPEVVCLASKIRQRPYIAHFHLDVAPSSKAGFLLRIYKPLFLKYVLRSAKAVTVLNEAQKIEIHRRYSVDLSKIHVIPNGVDEAFFYKKQRTLRSKPRLIFVGRLSVQKNVEQFIRALEGISNQFVTTIIGEGELKESLQALAKELKLQNVEFTGLKDRQETLESLQQADIFVLPSEREGMPLALLEAMAMALPVVATDVPGVQDVVAQGKNGILVPLHDTEALRDALMNIGTNGKLYEKMSHASRKLSENYSWDKVTTQFENVYREILRA